MPFNINGLPYGLGNKIEELINLEAYCIRTNDTCNYYWNNEDLRFSYPILVSFKNVAIQSEKRHSNAFTYYLGDSKRGSFTTREEKLLAIKNMNINMDLPLLTKEAYTSVHIRRGDRIRTSHIYCDYMSLNMSNTLVDVTAKLINLEKPKNIFVCSDDNEVKYSFISKLDKNISIIAPIKMGRYPLVYEEWYALAYSSKIYMCSKLSSFAAIASLVNDIPLVSFFDEKESTLCRCSTRVEYPFRKKVCS